ncbi:nitroreductase/quinone reductase family protein [Kitasatospora sp. NPDC058965]|uniref:nitroreductase/quinone reductase family protein n=1 Tax=Kitasatospora sp. NPDC058965 TaxID=3346682 RepID=UPI00368447BA
MPVGPQVTYLRDGDRLVLFGANGGRANHPGWYHNLLADPKGPSRGRRRVLRGKGDECRGGQNASACGANSRSTPRTSPAFRSGPNAVAQLSF